MKGKQYITRSEEFDRVYHQNTALTSGLIVIRMAPNQMIFSRYGYSISKRVGNAVTRNRVRRRLREIMRQLTLKPGWDFVLIVRPAAAGVSFSALQKTVERLLLHASMLGETNASHCRNTY